MLFFLKKVHLLFVPMQLAKSEKSDEVDVTAKKEVSSSNVQPMKDEHWGKAETGRVQENAPVYQPPDKNKPNLGERVDVIHEGARGKSSNQWYLIVTYFRGT